MPDGMEVDFDSDSDGLHSAYNSDDEDNESQLLLKMYEPAPHTNSKKFIYFN